MKYSSIKKLLFRIKIIDVLVNEELQKDANERSLKNIFDNLYLATEIEQIRPNSQSLRAVSIPTRKSNIKRYRESLWVAIHYTKIG
jgi:hypothetical protein